MLDTFNSFHEMKWMNATQSSGQEESGYLSPSHREMLGENSVTAAVQNIMLLDVAFAGHVASFLKRDLFSEFMSTFVLLYPRHLAMT